MSRQKRTRESSFSDMARSMNMGVAYFPSEPICDDLNMEQEDLPAAINAQKNNETNMKTLSNDMSKLWSPGLGTSYLWSTGPSPPPRSVSFVSSDEGSDLCTPTSATRDRNSTRRSKISRPSSFKQMHNNSDEEYEFPQSLPQLTRKSFECNSKKIIIMKTEGKETSISRNVVGGYGSKADYTDDSETDTTQNVPGISRPRSRCSSSGSMSGDL